MIGVLLVVLVVLVIAALLVPNVKFTETKKVAAVGREAIRLAETSTAIPRTPTKRQPTIRR
jgi:competence protein ComGC